MLSRHILGSRFSGRLAIPFRQKINTRILQIRFNSTNPDPQKQYSKEAIMNSLNSLTNEIRNTSYVSEFNEVVNNVMQEMEKKKISMMKFKIGVGVVILIIILALYDIITSWMSGQVNVITEKSLEDEELKQKLVSVCEETIRELVKSKQTQDDIIKLLKVAVIDLTENPEVQNQLKELIKMCVAELAHDDEIRKNLDELLKPVVGDLSEDPEVKEKLRQLVLTTLEDVSKDETVHNQCGQLMKSSLYAAVFNSGSTTSTTKE